MYLRPTTLDEALDALSAGPAPVLSGGTDFFPALGERPFPPRVLDVTALPELAGIAIRDTEIRFGARATWSEITRAPLPPSLRALQQAAREVGSMQVQTRGTLAGNLCNASPAADGVPPLLILDAEVELASRAGTRREPLAQFIRGSRATTRRPDELVTAVIVPRTLDAGRSAFLKLGARRFLVISIAMVAALVEADERGRVRAARIAVGSCSAVARRLPELEAALVGHPVRPGLGSIAEERHCADLAPIDDLRATSAYRREAALHLVRRALDACVA
ncbi:MAG TPA: xanthine dehydrogenase family protein subunit M [Beijerinckiaceae bacterium]|jgi:CO/xanthine dehydrogenase FAD-binding subunit